MADPNQSVVRARIDSELKQRAEEVLKAQHLDVSKALRIFLEAVVRNKGIPEGVHAPVATGDLAMDLFARNSPAIVKGQFARELTALHGELATEQKRSNPNAANIARIQGELTALHTGRFSNAPGASKIKLGSSEGHRR